MASKRSEAARAWATILSQRSGVDVAVEWHASSKAWAVRWADGPSVGQLRDYAGGVAAAGVIGGLRADRLHWQRNYTPTAWAWALVWAAAGHLGADLTESGSGAGWQERVEAGLDGIAYPTGLPGTDQPAGAGEVLAVLGRHDPTTIATLADRARSRLARLRLPPPPDDRELPGTVTAVAWPGPGAPPAGLFSPTGPAAEATPGESTATPAHDETKRNGTCVGCGRPLILAATGRPRRYCGPTCRSRAWRGHAKLDQATVQPDHTRQTGPAEPPGPAQQQENRPEPEPTRRNETQATKPGPVSAEVKPRAAKPTRQAKLPPPIRKDSTYQLQPLADGVYAVNLDGKQRVGAVRRVDRASGRTGREWEAVDDLGLRVDNLGSDATARRNSRTRDRAAITLLAVLQTRREHRLADRRHDRASRARTRQLEQENGAP